MSKPFTKLAVAIAAGAYLFGASPADAAMQLNSNGTVTVSGSSGGSVVLNLDGNSEGSSVAGLSSSLTLQFLGAANNVYTFSYTLQNTSSAPTLTSRLNAFAFDTNPNVVTNGATVLSGGVLTNVTQNSNMPNGVGNVEICLTANNCSGGRNGGLNIGQSTTGSFSLDFGNAVFADLVLSNFAVRYQNLSGPPSSGSGTGQVIIAAVPEPGTWAMMLLGFGAIGLGMRRLRSANKGLPQIA